MVKMLQWIWNLLFNAFQICVVTVCFAIAVTACGADAGLEYKGIVARTVKFSEDYWILVAVCVTFHLAVLFSPLARRHGLMSRSTAFIVMFCIITPYSIVQTLVGLGAFSAQQAQVAEISAEALAIKKQTVAAAQNAARIQQDYDYATRSIDSLIVADQVTDSMMTAARESKISTAQAYEVPLLVMQKLIPSPALAELNQRGLETAHYTFMSIGLMLISWLFSDIGVRRLESIRLVSLKSSVNSPFFKKLRTFIKLPRLGQKRTRKSVRGTLSDKEIRAAVRERLRSDKSVVAADINRKWVQDACIQAHGRARKGVTLDPVVKWARGQVGNNVVNIFGKKEAA